MEFHLRMNNKMGTIPLLLNYCDQRNTILCKATKMAMPKGNKTNFYEVLSLGSQTVGFDEIKTAYRAMALKCHPDVCPPSTREESTRLFIELQEAYETLSDPIMRENYDYDLSMVDLLGSSGFCYKNSSVFPKVVWYRQLGCLRKRCLERAEAGEDEMRNKGK